MNRRFRADGRCVLAVRASRLDAEPAARPVLGLAARVQAGSLHHNRGCLHHTAAVLAWVAICGATGVAADLETAEGLFRTGQYEECARVAGQEMQRGLWGEQWALLAIRSELARGEYAAAAAALEQGLRRAPSSVPLQLLGREVHRFNGRDREAAATMEEIERLVLSAPHRYASPEGRVALGRFFLLRGADARQVLDQFYDVAKKQRPDLLDIHYATAELALDKQDDALAAETLKAAPDEAEDDPHYHYLLACAFAEGDRAAAAEALTAALAINPHHADSLLLQADQLIDEERYDEAAKVLDRVLTVNPHEPRAWAYRAVLAHIRSDGDAEKSARDSALAHWKTNPEVDHVIGRELSQKYRFAEGAAAQRKALEFDPAYRPAKVQLCQDLLRLGQEEEGWTLAEEVLAEDGYNVVGFNLVTLRDQIAEFRTLRGDGFIVRMDAREADLYGRRVLELLDEARETLGKKYEVALDGEVTIEIFPRQKDFAVRTFGLPGADGFLGVCFGRVITVNSPASQGADPANWEAVVWHEFCHTVTLTKTRNKMPRWLSEGISVYEEGQRDPAWATRLNPRFREMILGEDFTPLSRLSGAFLAPESAVHLQFAYFESALAVEFLVERFGLPKLRDLLDDLGSGVPMNEALAKRTGIPLDQLDDYFAKFAHERAEALAPDATWEQPELPPDADSTALSEWVEEHPQSFWGRQRLGARLVAEERWAEAEETLRSLTKLYPDYVGPDNAYMLLATVYRGTSDVADERAVLEELAERDGDAGDACLRLIELCRDAGDWEGVARNAKRLLAVNPLVAAPHRALAQAAERSGERDEAVAAYRALSLLDDTDPAEIHYRLAKLLNQGGKPDEALREVLKSLEEAPRFRDSHRLLLELVEANDRASSGRDLLPVEAARP